MASDSEMNNAIDDALQASSAAQAKNISAYPRSIRGVATSAEEVGVLVRMSRHRPDGFVPVIGAGVAIAAAMPHNLPTGGEWAELLRSVSGALGYPLDDISRRPGSFLAAWEQMVTESADKQGIEPFQAEYALHKHVAMELRKLEIDANRLTLYQEIIKAGFSDIVSLNFDRRLALSFGKTRFIAGPRRPPEGPSGRTLYRHDVVTPANGGGETRIWYPHGDTKRMDTLRLGVRKYGFHLGLIRERLGIEDNAWRQRSWGTSDWESWTDIKAGDDEGMDTWVDLAMARPLVFLGCGLGSDEWSIWWLLLARCRDRDSPPALVAQVGPSAHATAALASAARVELVRFESFDHLWRVIREALS